MSTVPTVYFIDDSATMREVIKIAFRRENIQVVACHDAATALGEIEEATAEKFEGLKKELKEHLEDKEGDKSK